MEVDVFVGREQRFIKGVRHFVGGESGEGVVAGARGVDGDVAELATSLLGDSCEGGREVGVGFHVDNDGWQM